MVVDRFAKFILSVIAISLCLNALNPWMNPGLVEAAGDHIAMEKAIIKIAGGIERIAMGLDEMVEYEKGKRTREMTKLYIDSSGASSKDGSEGNSKGQNKNKKSSECDNN